MSDAVGNRLTGFGTGISGCGSPVIGSDRFSSGPCVVTVASMPIGKKGPSSPSRRVFEAEGRATRSRQDVARPGPGSSSPNAPSPAPQTQIGTQLHTANSMRKYLSAGERDAFLRAAEKADRQLRTLCMAFAFSGCRLSEALALTADRVELAAGSLVSESLKKRRSGIYRAVPVPPVLLEALEHGIREMQSRRGKGRGERLWPWSRMTGWRAVHAVLGHCQVN